MFQTPLHKESRPFLMHKSWVGFKGSRLKLVAPQKPQVSGAALEPESAEASSGTPKSRLPNLSRVTAGTLRTQRAYLEKCGLGRDG